MNKKGKQHCGKEGWKWEEARTPHDLWVRGGRLQVDGPGKAFGEPIRGAAGAELKAYLPALAGLPRDDITSLSGAVSSAAACLW